MLSYGDLYELLRKEKYSENLQALPQGFVSDMADFLMEQKGAADDGEGSILDGNFRSKKQLENSVALFKELILRRKKKLLNLIFVATETGIMKRDYENMLDFERKIFDVLAKTFEEGDKELARMIHGGKEKERNENSMILFSENTEQFVDMAGKLIGPFNVGELVNLDSSLCSILVSSGKASYVDEK
ncbi:hypothetical protein COU54_01005 [Candidatus Pacearchaeota archaeon CG10_big_fil_rev_8_21_14_0_10_31_24]|nr:MAG: hypothetical protein COU54_01005 [Candidatus Pacearchaeota archaeon CG10_big_fil_rev_8_21_14_0_10_31_24]